jgi:rare lipoprotein A
VINVKQIVLLLLAVILTGCVGSPPPQSSSSSRYEMENDSPELEPIDLSLVKQVVPVVEKRTLAGNKNPYTVNGQTYKLMESEAGYEETGIASWYGRKFHGHLTSNGEVYDMFELTAAHKTMPIPGYLEVTNLDNGKSVVVRVNDRGPFHSGRIVDLSYAAAAMLDYADKGTARVRVEALVPTNQANQVQVSAVSSNNSVDDIAIERRLIEEGIGQEYLQVGAFSNLNSAQSLVNLVSALTSLPVFIKSERRADANNILHRVRLGPLNETIEIQSLIQSIINANLGTPFKVRQ